MMRRSQERPNGHWTRSAERRVLALPAGAIRSELIRRLNASSFAPGWQVFGPISQDEVEFFLAKEEFASLRSPSSPLL